MANGTVVFLNEGSKQTSVSQLETSIWPILSFSEISCITSFTCVIGVDLHKSTERQAVFRFTDEKFQVIDLPTLFSDLGFCLMFK